MYAKKITFSLLVFVLASSVFAEKLTTIKPIVSIKAKYNDASFSKILKRAGSKKPLTFKTEEDALKYFDKKGLESIKKQMSFKTQKLIAIVWRGSGRDEINFHVMESFPEQIRFNFKPGMTKDLKPHLKLFALRKNVKIR